MIKVEEGKKAKKKYIKPTVEIVELRVNERIAVCTSYPNGRDADCGSGSTNSHH